MEDLAVHLPEALAEGRQRDQLLGIVAEDVGRHLVEERLDGPQDLVDVVVEGVVGVGIVRAVASDLLEVLAVILAQQEVVAVLLGAERGGHQDGHEAVLGELEVLDDVRAQETQGVRKGGEPESRPELLRDSRPADERAPLEDQRPEAGPC